MSKEAIAFEDFLATIEPLDFVTQMHDYLLENGCTIEIKQAKSGYVVSYLYDKKVIANYVSRRKGLIIRIYGNNCGKYEELINSLPDNMVKEVEKAPACKRMLDLSKCNSRCQMGYVFDLNGVQQKKCRYNCFMFLISDENNQYINKLVQHELEARKAI